MVWVLLPVGGLLTVELASFVIRRIFNKLTTHGPYIKVYPHPGFLASQHKYKARRGDAVAPTAHCVPCLSPAATVRNGTGRLKVPKRIFEPDEAGSAASMGPAP